jgi:hypothetical protein
MNIVLVTANCVPVWESHNHIGNHAVGWIVNIFSFTAEQEGKALGIGNFCGGFVADGPATIAWNPKGSDSTLIELHTGHRFHCVTPDLFHSSYLHFMSALNLRRTHTCRVEVLTFIFPGRQKFAVIDIIRAATSQ